MTDDITENDGEIARILAEEYLLVELLRYLVLFLFCFSSRKV